MTADGELGVLWEHYVLNELHARLQSRRMNYWRDKHGHEVDFVCARRGRPPLAIECKWSAALHYPKAECFVVSQDTDRTATRRYGDLKVSFVSLESLVNALAPSVE
jgi:predicted AAA+ superfamily ATPase